MTDAPTDQQPDEHTQAAIDEEQTLVREVGMSAQIQHLLGRAMALNAENRRQVARVTELEASLAERDERIAELEAASVPPACDDTDGERIVDGSIPGHVVPPESYSGSI